ncbi:hypothetical protein [Burkholderia pseudomallei]|uniref:hypothetical protein n=1 Tax=Burkholderia pseudomallei TaxID=28450 RepID=UPI000F07746B|nr:hypothetical protein [Burkholderia pseudomallei]CAJ3072804.1 Uncharacterised protein [Burkholderia pseudomallei]VCK72863.1 Uncharacterised protein [Burkholderia pseudomallei]VCK79987.1 Uncharacterised protein [Burkholderia pseudomallei]VCK80030.1 Uncharacterised protein [Burkholderia pseudomallei]VCK80792.1 Uncharacterised protein [Burkholderia pseudomallei]
MNETPTPTTANIDASLATPPIPSPGALRAMNAISWLLKPGGNPDAIDRAVAFSDRDEQRPLLSFHHELLALPCDENHRTHHLYARIPAHIPTFTLHVWPGRIPEGEVAVELPLHGSTMTLGFAGREALRTWVDLLSQILEQPDPGMQPDFYHPFVFALNALDAKGVL